MQQLKVCFVGVGSIAKRHIRNLGAICSGRGIQVRMDALRHGGAVQAPEGIEQVYTSPEDLPSDYEMLFITNPTELHLNTLCQLHDKAKSFFIEKPAVSFRQLEEAKRFPLRADSLYYVACPLRYNAVIQYIRRNIDLEDVISVRSISFSYLPDWRPGQDYRKTYSASRELGGGVSIDLIHEWDYLTYLFGWPNKVLHLIGKKSSLEIDSDDYAIYLAEYEKPIVELHLDYFGRKTIRSVELFTGQDTILGDIANNQISFLLEGKTLDFSEARDDYQRRELEHFLNVFFGLDAQEDGFTHGLRVLELTQGIVSG